MKANGIILWAIAAAMTGAADAATSPQSPSQVQMMQPLYRNPEMMVVRSVGNSNKKAEPDRFYIGARFDYTLSSFSNKYSIASDPSDTDTDSFSMKPSMGFNVAFGYRLDPKWRMELNWAYTGKFEDKDSDMSFDIGAHIFAVNGIYTIKEWTTTGVYAGAGVGFGLLSTNFSAPGGTFALGAETNKSSVGFYGNIQLGIEEKISDNVILGAYYKLGYLTGHEQRILLGGDDTFISENKGVLTNGIGIGLKMTF